MVFPDQRNRKKGNAPLFVIASAAALTLVLMLTTVFRPSNDSSARRAQASTTTKLYPVADAIIKGEHPDRNYGTTNPLSCQGDDLRISYFKFDLSGLSDQKIISAYLKLTLTSDGGSDAEQTIKVVRSSDWEESTITYNKVFKSGNDALKPYAIIATLDGGRGNEVLTIPVTTAVSEYAGNMLTLACVPKYFDDPSADEEDDDLKFFPREAGSGRPELIIEHQPKPTNTPVITKTPTPTKTATPTPLPSATAIPTKTPTPITFPITGVSNGQTLSGIVQISYGADPTLTASVDFLIDGQLVNTDTTAPYQLNAGSFDTNLIANGSHTLSANANLKDGNWIAATVTFSVYNAPPTPTLTPTLIPTTSTAPTLTTAPTQYPTSPITITTTPISLTPTSIPCVLPSRPENISPQGQKTAGPTLFTWNPVPTAIRYALRIDDKVDDWDISYNGAVCSANNPNDICIDDLTNVNYTYTLEEGHTYRWWVHALNACGEWSPAAIGEITVSAGATITLSPPVSVSPSVTISAPPPPYDKCPYHPYGDADCNKLINLVDFEIWRGQFINQTIDPQSSADFDNDGDVDLVDFEAWRQGFIQQPVILPT